MKKLTTLFLMLLSATAYAGIFSIVPKEGTNFPTQMTPGYNVSAYYTITNNTSKNLNNCYVKSLPRNVSQVTTNGDYEDTAGAAFDLAAGESCTLQLTVSGLVKPEKPRSGNALFVSLPGGKKGSGTRYPLKVKKSPWVDLSDSYEIIYVATATAFPTDFVLTYKEGGSNPINGTEWETYTPPSGYTKNTTRYLQFEQSIDLGGPGDPIGTQTFITTSDGYTWGAISNVINAMWPFDPSQYSGAAATSPFRAGNLVLTPPPGVLKITANYKPQLMKYYANQDGKPPGTPGAVPIPRFFIKDPWGNIYLMQASDYSTIEETAVAFDAAILPPGWTKQTRALDKDLVLHPSQGPATTFEYTLIRDNQNNTYNQIYWSNNGNLVSTQIQESGMPIWSGREKNVIKITKSFDNLIYGGGGVTAFIFPKSLTAGTNTIADFNPYLGDTLNFDGQDYITLITPYGVQLNLSHGASVLLQGIYIFEDSWVVG